MAFKPIVIEKEIDGITYKAQFNGMSQRNKIVALANEGMDEVVPFLIENVLVEPKIGDIDEYFGTDTKHYDAVTAFMIKVGAADKEYFPVSDEKSNKGKSK